jgi:hypothetical protein
MIHCQRTGFVGSIAYGKTDELDVTERLRCVAWEEQYVVSRADL